MDNKDIVLILAIIEALMRYGPATVIETIKLIEEDEITPEAIRDLKVKEPKDYLN
jgi:hypothetical protein